MQKEINDGLAGMWTMELNVGGRRRYEAIIAIILFLTVLSAYLTRVSLSVAMPYVAETFQWDQEQLGGLGGVLLGIFLVGYGLSNIFISPLVDCYGPRKSLLVAVSVWSVFTLLTGIIGVYCSVFVLLRVLLGLSQGIAFPSASSVTQAWFPPEKRSRMNSIYYSSIAFANLLSPLLLLPLIMVTSWNIMFVVLSLLGFAILVPIFFLLKDSPEGPPDCEKKTLRDNLRLTRDNLKESLRIKGIFTLTLSQTLEVLVFWGISLWLPTFLVLARGFTTSELVWAAALPYVGYIVGLLVGSWISDRVGRRSTVTAAFSFAGAVMIAIVNFIHGRWETLVSLGGLFFFLALLSPNITTLLQGCCVNRLTCSATGIVNGFSNGAGALGPIIFGVLAAYTGSYDSALPLMTVMMIASGLVILRFRVYEVPVVCPLPETPDEKE
jgi:sugar phosphate permease